MNPVRNLILVLGDQLDLESPLIKNADPNLDRIWMAEVEEESVHVWSHKQKIVLFLSAMRHFRASLLAQGLPLVYTELDDGVDSFSVSLKYTLKEYKPETVMVLQPGSWRVLEAIQSVCTKASVVLEVFEDDHFFTSPKDFRFFAENRKAIRMEYFYRGLRKQYGVLMEEGEPMGGVWNLDKENRKAFSKSGPESSYHGHRHQPDAITEEVIKSVEKRFPNHPGSLASFHWAVTRKQALEDLNHFIEHRLPYFGTHQDAMWKNEPWLFHSLLSSSLNLKLLRAKEVVKAAEQAYSERDLSLASVEGFIRQILGWREYIRGVYWTYMPEYVEKNALSASGALPKFYWTGETEFECLKQTIGQTLDHGYAHHIQRLMVTGLYALLLGVDPKYVHQWYLAIYIDAVEWVELPNVIGMSQFADGGLMASKPYAATGKYIQRMSNYCESCPKNPEKRVGEDACPFTNLYWDFLIRHEDVLKKNQRMQLQLRNLNRLSDEDRLAIGEQAKVFKDTISEKVDTYG